MESTKNQNLIISYLTLRKLIGLSGIALPFICILLGYLVSKLPIQKSISFYYHTNVRDIFVGLMIAISLFLITYKGYELIDNIVTTLSGIAGFGIAIFPCKYSDAWMSKIGTFKIDSTISNNIHLTFAAIFFILLAINSIFLFTKSTGKGNETKKKIQRNRLYRICGVIILSLLLSLFLIKLVITKEIVKKYCIVLIIETFMLIAFGISWIVKGEAILKDSMSMTLEKSAHLWAGLKAYRR